METTTSTTTASSGLPQINSQAVIIGVIVGVVALIVIIVIVVVCVCCRKAERSCLKRSVRRTEKKYEKEKNTMTLQQAQRREEMEKRHAEIRNKYGLTNNNSDLQPPRDNIFSVENEQISLALKK